MDTGLFAPARRSPELRASWGAGSDDLVALYVGRLAPENIEGLCLVMTADRLGRPPLPPKTPSTVKVLLDKAHELQVQKSAPAAILLGRHLIELGLQPGPAFGKILHEAYEAQLEGTFSDLPQALAWFKEQKHLEVNRE